MTNKIKNNNNSLLVMIVCLILAFSHQTVFTQTETTIKGTKIGINLSSFYSSLIGMYISPSVKIQKGRHSFSVGPKIFINKTGTKTLTLPNPITPAEKIGIQGNYQYYPNLIRKYVNFYFQYQIHYVSFHSLLTGYDYINNKGIENKKYKVFENKIGYGFDFKLSQNLYINQSIVYGLDLMRIKAGDTSYADELHGSFTVTFGIGFNFNKQNDEK